LIPTPSYIATYTGSFCFADPNKEDIRPLDIAHALAQIPRFGGHAPKFYSVAQHTINVARLLKTRELPREVQLRGLLHDAGEAYVGDMVSPLKKNFPTFRAVEDEILALIYESAGLPVVDKLADAEVKRADADMLVAEAQALFDEEHYDRYFGHYFPALPADAPRILPVRWDVAEGMWLFHWNKLYRPRS
jgi:hypothetical protein